MFRRQNDRIFKIAQYSMAHAEKKQKKKHRKNFFYFPAMNWPEDGTQQTKLISIFFIHIQILNRQFQQDPATSAAGKSFLSNTNRINSTITYRYDFKSPNDTGFLHFLQEKPLFEPGQV